jgi:hypothetical protein
MRSRSAANVTERSGGAQQRGDVGLAGSGGKLLAKRCNLSALPPHVLELRPQLRQRDGERLARCQPGIPQEPIERRGERQSARREEGGALSSGGPRQIDSSGLPPMSTFVAAAR